MALRNRLLNIDELFIDVLIRNQLRILLDGLLLSAHELLRRTDLLRARGLCLLDFKLDLVVEHLSDLWICIFCTRVSLYLVLGQLQSLASLLCHF